MEYYARAITCCLLLQNAFSKFGVDRLDTLLHTFGMQQFNDLLLFGIFVRLTNQIVLQILLPCGKLPVTNRWSLIRWDVRCF